MFQELQHAQRLERLREEQRAVQDKVSQKQQFEHKYEPCVVCGDRASGVCALCLSLNQSGFFFSFLLVYEKLKNG